MVNCIAPVPFTKNGYLHSLVDFQREVVSCGIDGSIINWKMGEVGIRVKIMIY